MTKKKTPEFNFRSVNVPWEVSNLITTGQFHSGRGKGIKYKYDTLTAYVKPCCLSYVHHIALHGETASETGYRSNYFMVDDWESLDDFLNSIPAWLNEWHEKNIKFKKKPPAQLVLF